MTNYDLTKFVKLHFDSDEDKATGWVLTLHYLIDMYKANDWQHTIKLHLNKRCSAKKARLKLLSRGYFFNLKMFLCESQKTNDLFALKEKYSISDRDFRKLKLDLEDEKFQRILRKRLKGIKDLEWQPVFGLIYNDVLKYIKYLAYNKLRFIAQANNCNVADLYPELIEVAVKAFHRLWPTNQSTAYITNYVKRSVHNRTINFIKFSTTQKRGRIINVGKTRNGENQFSLLEIGESRFGQKSIDGESISLEDLQSDSDRNSIQFQFELTLSVQAILKRYKTMPKKYKFLSILLGNDDEGFTTWLRWRNLISHKETNVDFQESVSPRDFTQHLCKYMHIKVKSCEQFLARVGTHLGYEVRTNNELEYS